MEIMVSLNKQKNKIINIAAIILALMIAKNIGQKQVGLITSLREKRETEEKKDKLLTQISATEKKIEAYNNLLAREGSEQVINTISNIAKEFDLQIISLRPTGEQRFPEYTRLPFDLTVNVANYHLLAKFISKIENSPEVCIVEGLDIKPFREQKRLSVNLKMSAIRGAY